MAQTHLNQQETKKGMPVGCTLGAGPNGENTARQSPPAAAERKRDQQEEIQAPKQDISNQERPLSQKPLGLNGNGEG